MSYIKVSRYAAFGLATVAGLAVASTDPGITLVAGEAQVRQLADTNVESPSFSYRVVGATPTVKIRTRDFLFCANSGDPGLKASNTRLDLQREDFVFGTTDRHGNLMVVDDVRDFSYGKGGPVVRVSAAAPNSSTPGTLVCLSMDDNGERHHAGSGLFGDPFESPRSCSDHSTPCSPKFNSSVRIEAVAAGDPMYEGLYIHYLVVVEFDNVLAGNGSRLVLRDGYDTRTFGEASWCQVNYSSVQSGLQGFDMATHCAGAINHSATVDSSFNIFPAHGPRVAYYVRRHFHVGPPENGGHPSPPALAERPVLAAALFPDPAAEEMRTDDNVAGYPSTPEQVTEFQHLLEDALIQLEAQSTWQ